MSKFVHIPKEKLSEILKIGIILDVGWAGNDVVFQVMDGKD